MISSAELVALLPSVQAAAVEAGQLLSQYSADLGSSNIRSKSNAVDLVSDADEAAERLIQSRLKQAFPEAGFIGEESSHVPRDEQASYYWVVDPLDGTSNFLSGVPFWAVSIALTDAALQPLIGVIHAPVLGRMWHAALGAGCFCNGVSCQVRQEPPGGGFGNAMLATGFPYSVSGGADINIRNFVRMQAQFHKIRRIGSAAIDLAFLAEGVFDGMWELLLQPWDTAAGMLLVTEAGGSLSRFDGQPYRPGDPDLAAAATPALLQQMLDILNAPGTDQPAGC
jgi:myo-inositol-1(or 4)-monophosphatase